MVPGPNGPAYRLALKPNPNFTPPDREADVYHGMEGELWIDKDQQRIVRFDAHLVQDVNFGWGILGSSTKAAPSPRSSAMSAITIGNPPS